MIALLVLPGFIFGKLKIFPDTMAKSLSSMVINLCLPAVIIEALQVNYSTSLALNIALCVIMWAVIVIISFGISMLLKKAMNLQSKFSIDGSIHYQCMDWRHVTEILEAGSQVYSSLKNICVWDKTTAGMGSLYRSQHEFVFVFKNGEKSHINNIELGIHGRYRTNIWKYSKFSFKKY